MFRALEPWHLIVLLVLVAIPALAVVLVVRIARRPSVPGSPLPPGVFTDPASGRRYTVDPATGQSRWLDEGPQPPPPPA